MVTRPPANDPGSARALDGDAGGGGNDRAATFGRLIALMMTSPRHSGLTLAEANAHVAPALALGQIALMGAKTGDSSTLAIAAAVWWAYVSPDADQRLTASRDNHLKLSPEDWNSGDQPWIVDAIGDQRIVSELVKKLAEHHFKGKPAKLRAVLPDGRIAVGRLEPRPPSSDPV